MSPATFTESIVEQAALNWLEGLGYGVLGGPDTLPDGGAPTTRESGVPYLAGAVQDIPPGAERADYGEVVLARRLRAALRRLNPTLPAEALDEAARKVTRPEAPSLVANNRSFHRMLVEGVPVEYRNGDGGIRGAQVWLIDYERPAANDWLAVNQFTVVENGHTRRPDVVIFVNGLPLAVIELKNATDEDATIWSAFNQLQTYKQQIPALFVYNEALVISDGLGARIGTLTADQEWFMPWRSIEGEELAPASLSQLEVLLRGVFDRQRFLDLVRYFTVFEDDGGGAPVKKMAGYHQFHAVNRALAETIGAASEGGDGRAGVVWHTQGSGKSLTMAFYAGRVILDPAMQNPTLVVVTDRNDLDDQLFGTFARCRELLRQAPVQATDRDELQQFLRVASGGVVFTTIQKFVPEDRNQRYPRLSDRHNIVVIADEAHRSQYGFDAKLDQKRGDLQYGFAQHLRDALPNASFIGFTGTPVETKDANTRAVFGDYVSVYDIQRAVADGATVPIYYESRLAQLAIDEREKPHIDRQFEEVTEGEEIQRKQQLKSKWAALEAIVGAERRIGLIAQDLVRHFEARQEAIAGKAMVVCMSRRICVDLYSAITRLRPAWHTEDDTVGAIKVVMTGSASDPASWQQHIRPKARREALALRFKDPHDALRIVIVRDMWLTGFDVPVLHTMYVDKPMRSHGLMQAIARVNRVWKDKPGGLVVDYLGLADQLREALAEYTASQGQGRPTLDQAEAVAVMLEKYEICRDLFFGLDWSAWTAGTPAERLSLLPAAQEHILQQENGKERLLKAVGDLSPAFALAVPHEEALGIRDDVAFFQALRTVLAKASTERKKSADQLDQAVRQIVSKAIASDEVVDIFTAAGLRRPDLSILSDEFLADVRGMPHKNLAIEVLRRLLNDETRARARSNVVLARAFSQMLERSIRSYQSRAVETAHIIEELIKLAQELREAAQRGETLGLSDDEVAFYDALAQNGSAVEVMGDEQLKIIARELVKTVRGNVTIDWTVKETVRAKLRTLVKRILRKFGYPPDLQEQATKTVLEQAETLSAAWTESLSYD